jgi:Zn-dependent protease with chaperone function
MVLRTFDELKRAGCISDKRRLVRKGDLLDSSTQFHGGRLFHWRIYYRLGKCSLSPNELRFILLHEEGHARSLQVWQIFMVALAAVLVWLNFLYRPSVFQESILPLVIADVLVSAVGFRMFLASLRWDEYAADRYGAIVLRDRFGIAKPSRVLQDVLASLDSSSASLSRRREKIAKTYWMILGAIFGDPHPIAEDRVKRIRETVDV